jgi:hypothetical protein
VEGFEQSQSLGIQGLNVHYLLQIAGASKPWRPKWSARFLT